MLTETALDRAFGPADLEPLAAKDLDRVAPRECDTAPVVELDPDEIVVDICLV